jgi:hypothetical protein
MDLYHIVVLGNPLHEGTTNAYEHAKRVQPSMHNEHG